MTSVQSTDLRIVSRSLLQVVIEVTQYENFARQMKFYILLTKNLHIFCSRSGCLLLKIKYPSHPQNILQLNTDVQIFVDILFALLIKAFYSFYRLFPSLIQTDFISCCGVTPGGVNVSVYFRDHYLSLVSNFYIIHRQIIHR